MADVSDGAASCGWIGDNEDAPVLPTHRAANVSEHLVNDRMLRLVTNR